MNNRFATRFLLLVIAACVATGGILQVPYACAEQNGTFTGAWAASGKRQPFDFVEGREVGTFDLAGNVSLKDEFGEVEDFWAECVGLSDSEAGSSVRCVWKSLKGDKAYSVLTGQPLEEGVKITGRFVGGTGGLTGASGDFTFTWSFTFTDKGQGMFTGYTKNLSGSYRIP